MSREEKKLSGAMRLFEALSGVDEELLANADAAEREVAVVKKAKIRAFSGSKVRLAASLAAAASLFLVVGAVWTGAPMLNGRKSAETAAVTTGNWTGNTTADSTAEVTEELADEAFGADVEEAIEEEAVEEEMAKDIDGNMADDTKESEKGNNEVQKHAQKSESQTDGIENKDALKREDGVITECVGSIVPDDRVELAEAQARVVEGLGAYIPSNIPKGYIWESARAAVNAETGEYESLFLCWTKGMDSIMITVSKVDADSFVLTDIDNPVFAAEDLSLELVQSRMKVIPDSGNTDTPRGNFSVIYPEGILVYFNGDGTAEEIWEMLR